MSPYVNLLSYDIVCYTNLYYLTIPYVTLCYLILSYVSLCFLKLIQLVRLCHLTLAYMCDLMSSYVALILRYLLFSQVISAYVMLLC